MSTDSGTIAFLMTDIAGSTRLWEDEPDAMAEALAAHDALLRSVVEAHQGRVVKTTGDGLLATFPAVSAGVLAATMAQRGLAERSWPTSVPLRVRMAIHAGEARVRDDDVFGPAINRVARLLGIGHGSQILLSSAVAALVGDEPPDGTVLADLGEHRLKDLAGAEHVFQLTVEGLADEFPALRSLRAERTNLPMQLTSFVGREMEIGEVRERLRESRLVTLIGTGGTGKTRLSLQVAAESVDRYRDGAWLVELAPVSDPHVIVPALAEALDVRERTGQTLEETLLDYLRDKQILIVLDNCEHLIADASRLAHRLLRECAELSIIATSREALGISGESTYQVPSLALPPEPAPTMSGEVPPAADPELIGESAAVRLFVERARAAVPGFVLDAANAAAVAQICRRLDGIPLALELAAARVSLLSASEIAGRLADRFRLLTGGSRTSLPRQQTLQALVDWSWELLDEPERCLFRRLSVFAGGWSLDGAEAVVGDPALDVFGALDHLVAKSLVVVERGPGGTRFRFLETMRQYARDRLIAAGEAEWVRNRHLAWCRALMASAEPKMRDGQMIPMLAILDPERDNMRVAVEWALESSPEEALALVDDAVFYLRTRSISAEGYETTLAAVAAVRALPPVEGAAAEARQDLLIRGIAAAVVAAVGGGFVWKTPPLLEELARMTERTGDPHVLLIAGIARSLASTWLGDRVNGPAAAEAVISLGTRLDEPWYVSLALGHRATFLSYSGRLEEADAPSREAIEVGIRTGNPFVIAMGALARGRICGHLGQAEEARRAFELAIARLEDLGDNGFIVMARSDMAHALRRLGEMDEAEAIYRETLPAWRHLGNRGAIAHQFESVAHVAASRGNPEEDRRAVTLLGVAATVREAAGAHRTPDEEIDFDNTVASLRERLGPAAADTAMAEGRAMHLDAATALAVR